MWCPNPKTRSPPMTSRRRETPCLRQPRFSTIMTSSGGKKRSRGNKSWREFFMRIRIATKTTEVSHAITKTSVPTIKPTSRRLLASRTNGKSRRAKSNSRTLNAKNRACPSLRYPTLILRERRRPTRGSSRDMRRPSRKINWSKSEQVTGFRPSLPEFTLTSVSRVTSTWMFETTWLQMTEELRWQSLLSDRGTDINKRKDWDLWSLTATKSFTESDWCPRVSRKSS